LRLFYQLTDLDGTNAYAIPRNGYSEKLVTPHRLAMLNPIGADGAYDLHGDRRAPSDRSSADLEFEFEAASFAALQTSIDALMAAVEGGTRDKGRRKLWRAEGATAPRWTYAKARATPDIERPPEQVVIAKANVGLELPEPYFYDPLTSAWLTGIGHTPTDFTSTPGIVGEPIAPDYVFDTFTITSSPFTFSLINSGDLECHRCIFRLASQGTAGFTNPLIENLTNGQSFSSTTDGATANSVLSVNSAPGLGRAQLSADAGATWVDDTPALLLGATQAVLMELQPGTNSFRYTDGGTPNLKLYIAWYHSYRD
jgi:hypothetical protein